MKKNTSRLYLDALPEGAQELLKPLQKIIPQTVLGGGSAIALQLGHRISYDLDFFISKTIPRNLPSKIQKEYEKMRTKIDTPDEMTCAIGETKVSVLAYPYAPLHRIKKTLGIHFFDLRDLASNKAYTIGRRGAWRDYVDIFTLLHNGFTLKNIVSEAEKRFRGAFNAKLFLEQLVYFDDIHDFSIEWMRGAHTGKEIKKYLEDAVRKFMG